MEREMNSTGNEANSNSRSAAAYFRCSSLDEAKSVEARLRAFAGERGLCFSGSVFDKPDRPPYSLLQLLSDGSAVNSAYLIIEDLDHLSSDPELRDALLFRLRRKGLKLISLKKLPAVSAVESCLQAVNDYFAVGGRWEEDHFPLKVLSYDRPTAGRIAYGYKLEDGRIAIDEETAAAVRMIFDLYAGGMPVAEISAALDAAFPELPHPNLSRIYGVVRNARYAGAAGAEDPYPPLIPLNTWFKCLAENERRGYSEPDTAYLLPFVEFSDGTRLYPDPKTPGLAAHRYRSGDRNGPECSAAEIENALLDGLGRKLRSVRELLTDKCIAGIRNAHIRYSARLDYVKSEYGGLKAEFESKYSACERLPYGKAITEFERDRAGLELLRSRLEWMEYRALEHSVSAEHIREFFGRFAELRSLPRAEQRFFIGRLVRRIRLDGDTLLFSLPGLEPVTVRAAGVFVKGFSSR